MTGIIGCLCNSLNLFTSYILFHLCALLFLSYVRSCLIKLKASFSITVVLSSQTSET